MSKTVTLRLNDDTYGLFRKLAEQDHRPLSNFIETAVRRYIEESEFADEYEMAEIKSNATLNRSLRRAHKEAAAGKGRFVG